MLRRLCKLLLRSISQLLPMNSSTRQLPINLDLPSYSGKAELRKATKNVSNVMQVGNKMVQSKSLALQVL